MKLLKKIFKRPRIDLHGFNYTVSELVELYKANQKAIKWHGEILNDSILKYKTSDTLFILGSGPSINKITSLQWDYIKKCNSIGFNFWLAHSFVPTYFMFQEAGVDMLNLLQARYNSYNNIPFILRGSGIAKGKLDFNDPRLGLLRSNPVYFMNEYPIHSSCSISPDLLYEYVSALGFLNKGCISSFVPKWRSTVGLIMSFAYQMGYDTIVLCGCDMMSNDHFWDEEPELYINDAYKLPFANIMQFVDKEVSHNTVPVYIMSFSKWMKKNGNLHTYISNSQTILYPELDIYPFST
jgi:hypothetical protein